MTSPNPRCPLCHGTGEREEWSFDASRQETRIDFVRCDCFSPEVERDYRQEREEGWANGKS